MKHFILYFFIMMFFIFFIVIFGRFAVEYLSVLCVNERYNGAVSYAGWSGFQFCDLERYATRKELANREYRYIYLKDDTATRNEIKNKIADNLNLNADLSPKANSFLEDPVELVEINIYNPDVLPVTLKGQEYNVTTIEIVAKIIVTMPFGEKKSYEKRTIVNADTFLMDIQKE